ncbi:MAG: hypothetical protein OEW37_04155 [Rhodospirillaceae bacterium]|nr:hypothetical protein [Rhodospirillaceae bacterium]
MRKIIKGAVVGAALLIAAPAYASGDGSAANQGNLNSALLVSNCVVCHGQGGDSQGHTPSIDGLNRAQMLNALTEFKSGARKGTIMTRIAPGYTDAQLEAIASELTGN